MSLTYFRFHILLILCLCLYPFCQVTLSFADLRAEFAMKGDAASTTTTVTLGDLNVRAHGNDLCHQHAKLLSRRRIVSPARGLKHNAASRKYGGDEDVDGGYEDDCEYLVDNDGLQEQSPLVQAFVQTLGEEEKANSGCDIAVRVRLEELIVVCPNPQKSQWLDTILQGFVQSSTVQYLNAELECLLLTKLHGLRDVLESNLEYLKSLAENKGARVAMDLNLRAPLVVVPEDHTLASSPYLSIDLGRVEVTTTALHSNQGGLLKRMKNGNENANEYDGIGNEGNDHESSEKDPEGDIHNNGVNGVSGGRGGVLEGAFGHFYDEITVRLANACVELVDGAAVPPFASVDYPSSSNSSATTKSLLVAPWDLQVVVHAVAPLGPPARALPACYVAGTAGPLSAQLSNQTCTALLRLATAFSPPTNEVASAKGTYNNKTSTCQGVNTAENAYAGAMAGGNDSQGSYSPFPSFDASLPASPSQGAVPTFSEPNAASLAPSGSAELPPALSDSAVGEPATFYPAVSTPGRWNRRSGDESDCSDAALSKNGGSSSSSSSGCRTPQHGRLSFVGITSLRTSAVKLASGHSMPTTPVLTPSQTPLRKPIASTPTNLENELKLDLDSAVDELMKKADSETEAPADTMQYGFSRDSMSRRSSSRSLKSFKSFRSFVSARGSIDGSRSRSRGGMSVKSGSISGGGNSSSDDDDDNESFYSLASGMGFGGTESSDAALDETAALIADYKDVIADLESSRADLVSCLRAGVNGSFGVLAVFEAVVAAETDSNALREDTAAENAEEDDDDDDEYEDHAAVAVAPAAALMNALAEKPALRHALLPSAPPLSPPASSSPPQPTGLSIEEEQAKEDNQFEESDLRGAEESLGGWRAVALALPLPRPNVTWSDLARLLSPHAAQSLSSALQEYEDELEEFRAVYADMEAALAETKAFAAGVGTGTYDPQAGAPFSAGEGQGLYGNSRFLPPGYTANAAVAVREDLRLTVSLPLVSVILLEVARSDTNKRTSSSSSSNQYKSR